MCSLCTDALEVNVDDFDIDDMMASSGIDTILDQLEQELSLQASQKTESGKATYFDKNGPALTKPLMYSCTNVLMYLSIDLVGLPLNH